MDGGAEGEIESECFNAASVLISIHGVSTHLGSARGRLVNALAVASAISMTIPRSESPEATDERYGYYHVGEIKGTHVEAQMEIFIRDFDSDSFDGGIDRNIKRGVTVCSFTYADGIFVVHLFFCR